MTQDIDQLTEVFKAATRKFLKGAAKYGTFNPVMFLMKVHPANAGTDSWMK